ncbi:hypothetical protein UXO11_23185 [Enterobacter wuhouensis]|uniref:hypothetical protein n=1 Tax=Enterobacter wuhouensis TaxID=2529381 RepID=UPI002FD2EAD9
MKVTKQQVIDAVSQSSVFKFVDDPISSRTFTVEWKGKRFFISFNDEKELADKTEDDELVERFGATDFSISSLLQPKFEDKSEQMIFNKYIIANKVNVDLEIPALVLYREFVDVYEVSVKHKIFFTQPVGMKTNVSKYIEGAVSSMLICVMLAMRKLSRELKEFKEDPEPFIKNARTEGMSEYEE